MERTPIYESCWIWPQYGDHVKSKTVDYGVGKVAGSLVDANGRPMSMVIWDANGRMTDELDTNLQIINRPQGRKP